MARLLTFGRERRRLRCASCGCLGRFHGQSNRKFWESSCCAVERRLARNREACRARTTAEFISKIEGGLAELEETIYWLELLAESGIVAKARLVEIHREANELTAILVTCVKNAKNKKAQNGAARRNQ
jgi:hypothetical protein